MMEIVTMFIVIDLLMPVILLSVYAVIVYYLNKSNPEE